MTSSHRAVCKKKSCDTWRRMDMMGSDCCVLHTVREREWSLNLIGALEGVTLLCFWDKTTDWLVDYWLNSFFFVLITSLFFYYSWFIQIVYFVNIIVQRNARFLGRRCSAGIQAFVQVDVFDLMAKHYRIMLFTLGNYIRAEWDVSPTTVQICKMSVQF